MKSRSARRRASTIPTRSSSEIGRAGLSRAGSTRDVEESFVQGRSAPPPQTLGVSHGPLLHSRAVGVLLTGAATSFAAESGISTADAARVHAVTAPTIDFSRPEAHESLSGGAGTFPGKSDAKAMSHPDTTLDDPSVEHFRLGFALFKKMWRRRRPPPRPPMGSARCSTRAPA